MSCQKCLEMVSAAACEGKLRLFLKLQASFSCVVYITDKFNSVYKQGIKTDTEGTVFIDLSLFPPAFFNRYAGDMLIQFKAKDDDCEFLTLTAPCGEIYSCISLSPTDITNTTPSQGFLQQENSTAGHGYVLQEGGGHIDL